MAQEDLKCLKTIHYSKDLGNVSPYVIIKQVKCLHYLECLKWSESSYYFILDGLNSQFFIRILFEEL